MKPALAIIGGGLIISSLTCWIAYSIGMSEPGETTPTAVTTEFSQFNGNDPNGPDCDCDNFRTHSQAQAFYEAAGGPQSDRHDLDRDRDGLACETLP